MTEEELQAEIESQKNLVPQNVVQYGDFVVKWSYDDEKPMAWLRALRDQKLKETDWMVSQDRPAISDELKNYRQALRDIPQNYPDPTYDTANGLGGVTWPTKPL
jgi:hypothetical protein